MRFIILLAAFAGVLAMDDPTFLQGGIDIGNTVRRRPPQLQRSNAMTPRPTGMGKSGTNWIACLKYGVPMKLVEVEICSGNLRSWIAASATNGKWEVDGNITWPCVGFGLGYFFGFDTATINHNTHNTASTVAGSQNDGCLPSGTVTIKFNALTKKVPKPPKKGPKIAGREISVGVTGWVAFSVTVAAEPATISGVGNNKYYKSNKKLLKWTIAISGGFGFEILGQSIFSGQAKGEIMLRGVSFEPWHVEAVELRFEISFTVPLLWAEVTFRFTVDNDGNWDVGLTFGVPIHVEMIGKAFASVGKDIVAGLEDIGEAVEGWVIRRRRARRRRHRRRNLVNLGGNRQNMKLNQTHLQACQGDCDDDDDCARGLECFQRQSSSQVPPGCKAGGTGDKPSYDYCTAPACPSQVNNTNWYGPSSPNGQFTITQWGYRVCAENKNGSPWSNVNLRFRCGARLVHIGKSETDKERCTYGDILVNMGGSKEDVPEEQHGHLLACQGDCDNDSDCAPGLECFQREESKQIPYACQKGGSGDIATYDYCVYPNQCSGEVNKKNWYGGKKHSDKFKIKQNGHVVCAFRTDILDGWGMELRFACGVNFVQIGASSSPSKCSYVAEYCPHTVVTTTPPPTPAPTPAPPTPTPTMSLEQTIMSKELNSTMATLNAGYRASQYR